MRRALTATSLQVTGRQEGQAKIATATVGTAFEVAAYTQFDGRRCFSGNLGIGNTARRPRTAWSPSTEKSVCWRLPRRPMRPAASATRGCRAFTPARSNPSLMPLRRLPPRSMRPVPSCWRPKQPTGLPSVIARVAAPRCTTVRATGTSCMCGTVPAAVAKLCLNPRGWRASTQGVGDGPGPRRARSAWGWVHREIAQTGHVPAELLRFETSSCEISPEMPEICCTIRIYAR